MKKSYQNIKICPNNTNQCNSTHPQFPIAEKNINQCGTQNNPQLKNEYAVCMCMCGSISLFVNSMTRIWTFLFGISYTGIQLEARPIMFIMVAEAASVWADKTHT